MEYFGDGIAEEIMSSLAKSGVIQVIGRRSAFLFKGKTDDIRTIAEKLRVEVILEGSVRKSGDRLRVAAQLVRARDGINLWSETYDRNLDDILDIQHSIASEVTAALSPVLGTAGGAESSAASYTENAAAYQAYLRGIQLFRRENDEALDLARDEFHRAVQLDPRFALAHAWLARTYAMLARRAHGDMAENRALANASLDRALALAKEHARIGRDTEVELVVYPPKRSLYEALADPFGASDQSGLLSAFLGLGDRRAIQTLTAPLRVFRRGEPLAIMPNVFVR